jgi:hypothetical protein
MSALYFFKNCQQVLFSEQDFMFLGVSFNSANYVPEYEFQLKEKCVAQKTSYRPQHKTIRYRCPTFK